MGTAFVSPLIWFFFIILPGFFRLILVVMQRTYFLEVMTPIFGCGRLRPLSNLEWYVPIQAVLLIYYFHRRFCDSERVLTEIRCLNSALQLVPREKQRHAYLAAVKQRYKHLPEINRIDR